MKIVILAGGLGTRLAEETEVRPKPMVEIGGMPILWHILKIYHGLRHSTSSTSPLVTRASSSNAGSWTTASLGGDMTIQTQLGDVLRRGRPREDWTVALDGNRQGHPHRRPPGPTCSQHLRGGTFMLTYGDGVANVDIKKLHGLPRSSHGKIATVTAVRPPARFGGSIFEGDLVRSFTEKPQAGEGWINGGFIVLEPGIFDFHRKRCDHSGNADPWNDLASEGQLAAYRHGDFWQCMDTLRDKLLLENLWSQGKAPWKTWE